MHRRRSTAVRKAKLNRNMLLLLLLGCAAEPRVGVDAGSPDTGGFVPDGGVGACGDSWVLTYAISGTFYITDTTLGMGDADRPLSEGVLKLRVVDDNGAPGAGPARLTAFSHGEKFSVTAFGIETNTDVSVRAGPDSCGLARGQRGGEDRARLCGTALRMWLENSFIFHNFLARLTVLYTLSF